VRNILWILICAFLPFEKAKAQTIDQKKLDTLIRNGQNYSVFRELSALDTLQLNKADLALYYSYKAKGHIIENETDQAYASYLRARALFFELDSTDKAMEINIDIAYISSFDKTNRAKADVFLQEYLDYALKKGNNLQIAKGYGSRASTLIEEAPLESLKLFKKAEVYGLRAKNATYLQNLYSNIAVLYNEMLQKPDSAIYFIDKSISYAQKNKDNEGICHNLINKASCFYYKQQYQKAIQTLQEADAIALSSNKKKIKSYILEFLALNYSHLGDYKNAYQSLDQSIILQSELNSEEQNKKISELNIKYETKEKQLENLTLKNKIQRNQIITYTILGLLIIVILLGILIYNNLSKKKKIAEQAELIQKQKLEKTLKNQELRDIDVMLESQEHERQQIANELHDHLGSLLATLKLNFQSLNKAAATHDSKLFDKTDALLDEAYQKVRNISHLKNLGHTGNEGLVVAVQKMAEKMTVINRLQINVFPFGLNERIANTIEITLFRIIQELCTNVIKHAAASEVNIYLTQHNTESINILIEDNGKGFDYQTVTTKDGIGLKSIEKKVEQLGGSFTVDSALQKGTTIIIDLPL